MRREQIALAVGFLGGMVVWSAVVGFWVGVLFFGGVLGLIGWDLWRTQ